jgi:hypothetical protein
MKWQEPLTVESSFFLCPGEPLGENVVEIAAQVIDPPMLAERIIDYYILPPTYVRDVFKRH